MAALTWRNVDAPDFRGTLAGQVASTNMLDNAFDQLGKSLSQVKQTQTNARDSQVLGQLIRTEDPAAYQRLLDGADLSGVSPDVLKEIDSRRTDLVNRAGARQNQAQTGYLNTRTQTQNSALDAARPAIAEFLAAGDDPAKQNAVRQKYGPILAELTADQQFGVGKNVQANTQDILANKGTRFDQGVEVRNDRDTQQATAFLNNLASNNIDAFGARKMITNDQTLSPGARSLVMAGASKLFPGTFGLLGSDAPAPVATGGKPGATPAGGGSPRSLTFADTIPFAETRDYVAKITTAAGNVSGSNSEKAEKLLPHLIQQESGGNPLAVSSKGAQGLGQVMPATGVNPGYGVKPLQNNSPQESARFAKDYLTAMLDKYDGDVPKALAAYNAGPGQVDEWVPVVSKKEITTAQSDVGTRQMQNQSQGSSKDLLANLADKSDTPTVATALVGETGSFAGEDKGQMVDLLNRIQREAGVSAKQAASIVSNNADKIGFWRGLLPNSVSGSLSDDFFGSGLGVNLDGIEAAIKEQKAGGTNKLALTNAALEATNAGLEQAYASYQTAQQQLTDVVNRAASQPIPKETIARYRQRAALAQASVNNLLAKQRDLEQTNPRFNPPEEKLPVFTRNKYKQ